MADTTTVPTIEETHVVPRRVLAIERLLFVLQRFVLFVCHVCDARATRRPTEHGTTLRRTERPREQETHRREGARQTDHARSHRPTSFPFLCSCALTLEKKNLQIYSTHIKGQARRCRVRQIYEKKSKEEKKWWNKSLYLLRLDIDRVLLTVKHGRLAID